MVWLPLLMEPEQGDIEAAIPAYDQVRWYQENDKVWIEQEPTCIVSQGGEAQALVGLLSGGEPVPRLPFTPTSEDDHYVLTFIRGKQSIRTHIFCFWGGDGRAYWVTAGGIYRLQAPEGIRHLYRRSIEKTYVQQIQEIMDTMTPGEGMAHMVQENEVLLPDFEKPTIADEATLFWGYNAHLLAKEGTDLVPHIGSLLSLTTYSLHPATWNVYTPLERPLAAVLSAGRQEIAAYRTQQVYYGLVGWRPQPEGYDRLDEEAVSWLVEASVLTPEEEALAGLEPEAVLDRFLQAYIQQDAMAMLACMSKENIVRSMSTTLTGELYITQAQRLGECGEGNRPQEVISVSLVETEPLADVPQDVCCYAVQMFWGSPFEVTTRTMAFQLLYESERTGWRVHQCSGEVYGL